MNNRGINEGRQCAREVDEYLMQSTRLPVTGGIIQRSNAALELLGRERAAPAPQVVVAAN
jgi:glutamate synthase (NADPH/NADH)